TTAAPPSPSKRARRTACCTTIPTPIRPTTMPTVAPSGSRRDSSPDVRRAARARFARELAVGQLEQVGQRDQAGCQRTLLEAPQLEQRARRAVALLVEEQVAERERHQEFAALQRVDARRRLMAVRADDGGDAAAVQRLRGGEVRRPRRASVF